MRRRRTPHRTGFTLIELLLAVSVIGIVSSVVIVAVSPRKNITSVRDAERKHMEKQLGQALYARLVDEWELPEGIPDGKANAKPVCRQDISDAACGGAGGVSLSALPPQYISAIPVDPVVPEDGKCTGYMVYQEVGRPRVYAANVGKLPGDVPEGACSGPPAVITTNLIGYWKFDDGAGTTATDSSGNNYNGTLAADGAQSTSAGSMWSTEKPAAIQFANAGSLRFDGLNDFVRLSHNAALRTYDYNDFTIMAWYKSAQTSTNVDQYVFGQYSGTSVGGVSVPSGDRYGLYLSPTDDSASPNSARFHLYQNDPVSCCTYGTKNIVTDQEWHHLVIVRRGGSTREVWIDGVKEGNTTGHNPAPLIDPRDGPTIGAETKTDPPGNPLDNEQTPNHLVNGWVDDVRLYDRALSDTEIEQIAAGEG